MPAPRPESIAWFERLYIGSLAVAAAVIAMGWDAASRLPDTVLLIAIVIGILLPLSLVLLVSRRRSKIAKWILVLLFLVGLASNASVYDPGVNWGVDVVMLLTMTMQMLAVALLFTAPARAWVAREDRTRGPTLE